jgi:hypothetical protein
VLILKPDVVRQQWEFQVGPSVGIAASDQIWVARYILEVRFAASPVWTQNRVLSSHASYR